MKTSKINLFKSYAFILTLGVVVLFSAFKSTKRDVQQQQSIAAIVSTNANFSLLKAAVVHAGLVSVLDGAGTFTVFAPDNKAFAAAGLDTDAKIKALPVETLKGILLYHVLGQKVASSAIAVGNNAEVKSVGGANLYVTKNNNGVFISGAKVTAADVMASNGVVHVINTVLMPPTGSIVQTGQANPNFTFLVAAVLRASEGTTNVAQVLSGNGPFTVFAPTNQAFMNAGFANIAAIQAADPEVLTKILTYHVIAGRVLSSDLSEGLKAATVNGATVTISLVGGAKVKGNGSAKAASVVQADLVTSNGVVHVIDSVLLP